MNNRNLILKKVRAAALKPTELPEVPMFDENLPPAWDSFTSGLIAMGGQIAEGDTSDLSAWLKTAFPEARVVCSATPEFSGNRDLSEVKDPHELHDVDVAVVRARFGVAETGSVYLSESELQINVLGFLAQHIVVLLDPSEVVGNLHHVYHRPEFNTARYAVLMTGPSATADIEGSLVFGAQGVRSLTVVPRLTYLQP
jgi:L-lactate dehydrogenase complex protein LldG